MGLNKRDIKDRGKMRLRVSVRESEIERERERERERIGGILILFDTPGNGRHFVVCKFAIQAVAVFFAFL